MRSGSEVTGRTYTLKMKQQKNAERKVLRISLVVSEQHTEEEMPLLCDIIYGRCFGRGKDRLFLFAFSDNFWSQTWR